MDSLFLDQLDTNEVPPRPPQRGAKLYYAADGTLKIRKFSETETLSGNAFPSDWTQITSGGEYVYSGTGEQITVTQDKTNVTITNVGSGNLVITDTDRSKYIIIEPGDIVTFDALWDVGGTFNLNVTNRQYLATSGNPKAYIRTQHGSVGQNLLFATTSGDGITFQPIDYQWPSRYPYYVRDASVIQYGETFVIAYTNAFQGTGSFGIATSEDLVNWTKVGDITVPGVVGTPFNTWAPEWFIEDGRYYITVRVSTENGNYSGAPGMLWTECTNPGTWTLFTNAQSIGGLPTNYNDVAIIKRGDTYYLYCFNGVDDIVVCRSFSPFTGYGSATILSAQWRVQISANDVEGPNPVHIKGDHYRLYFQKADNDECWFADSYDGMQTWSESVTVLGGSVPDGANGFGHGTVLPVELGVVSNTVPVSLQLVSETQTENLNKVQGQWFGGERDVFSTSGGIENVTSGVGFSVGSSSAAHGLVIKLNSPATTVGYSTTRYLIPLAQIFNGRGDLGYNVFTWSVPFKLFIDFQALSDFAAGSTIRFYLGASTSYTSGNVSTKAVGFHISNNQLVGVRHDGTSLSSTSPVDPAYQTYNRLFIYSDGTTVEYYLNNSKIGELSVPPTTTNWPNMAFTATVENSGTGAAQELIVARVGYYCRF